MFYSKTFTCLILFLCAPLALGRPPPIPRNNTHTSTQKAHAECYHAGWIHFYEPSSPNITLFIDTPWHLNYDQDLAKALALDGFLVIPDPERCAHERTLQNVIKSAVYRGSIGFDNFDIGEVANTELHAPSKGTVARVVRILQGTYPFVELGMIGFGVLLFIGLFLFLGLITLWFPTNAPNPAMSRNSRARNSMQNETRSLTSTASTSTLFRA